MRPFPAAARPAILTGVLSAALLAASCAGGPRPVDATPDPAAAPVPATAVPDPVPEPAFDPAKVPEGTRLDALARVAALVEELNGIIRRKDYDAWLSKLDAAYVARYSSPEVLAELSASGLLKRQGIVLGSLRDYFVSVVYPSRQYDRVDDIEFIAPDRVLAYTVTPKGERLVLYELAKSEDTWKISIGRLP